MFRPEIAGVSLLLIMAPFVMSSENASAAKGSIATAAQNGEKISFKAVLDARFKPEGKSEFAAFKKWSEEPTEAEFAEHFERLPSGPDGLPRRRPKDPCWALHTKSVYRAMAIAASAPSYTVAQNVWLEAHKIYENAVAGDRATRSSVPISQDVAASQQPPPAKLAQLVARGVPWREALAAKTTNPLTGEVVFWLVSAPLCDADKAGSNYLKVLLDTDSWPNEKKDGAQATKDAWTLAQHSDLDPKLQEDILTRLATFAQTGRASGKEFAFLYDRVATAQGRLQKYGTQFTVSDKDCIVMLPAEDANTLDKKRESIGLGPLSEYIPKLEEAYHKSACK